MAQVNYKFRRATREIYSIADINRFQGDLLDGIKDGFTSEFDTITMLTNRGRRIHSGLVFNITKRFSQGYSLSASYTYSRARDNIAEFDGVDFGGGASWSEFYNANEADAFNNNLDYGRDDIPHVLNIHSVWELPIFRHRSDWLGRVVGGWQLNSIWSLQSGGIFVPISTAAYGEGGDFNADGVRYDRPDTPTQSLPSSFSKSQWLNGALSASAFPLPDPSSPRPGTLPRGDMFRGPGYANIDAALVKEFGVGKERGRVQVRAETFNLFNRLNISGVENRINNGYFGHATQARQNRVVQLAVKFLF